MPTRWPTTGYDDDAGSETYGFAAAADQLETFLSAGVAIGATTLNVSSTTGFPARGALIIKRLTAVDQSPEVCTYTGKTGTSFTGVSPTVRAWASGDRVRNGPVAVNHNDIVAATLALEHRLKLDAPLSPAQITANQNNYNPTGLADTNLLRINSDAARSLTGLATGAAERRLVIVNTGAFTITLTGESGSSTAANRFITSVDIAAGAAAILTYDTTSSRWRFAGGLSLPHDHSTAGLGGSTLSPVVLTPSGLVAFTNQLTPAQITGNVDNWSPAGIDAAVVVRLSTDAQRNITGITNGQKGRLLVLMNTGSQLLILKHTQTSTAANRIVCPNSIDFILGPNDSVLLCYEDAGAFWHVIAQAFNDWPEMGAAVADADEFPAFDASASANRKVTATRLPTYVFSKFTGILSFPATQNASAGANDLDDYEEGTFTVILSGNTTAGTQTYGTRRARYIKVGSQVAIEVGCPITAKGGTMAGIPFMSSLPFASTSGNDVMLAGGATNTTFAAGYTFVGMLLSSSSIFPFQMGSGQPGGFLDTTNVTNTTDFFCTGTYLLI